MAVVVPPYASCSVTSYTLIYFLPPSGLSFILPQDTLHGSYLLGPSHYHAQRPTHRDPHTSFLYMLCKAVEHSQRTRDRDLSCCTHLPSHHTALLHLQHPTLRAVTHTNPMLPFVEVSHLPSSSSFYSAITQPLDLQYIYAADPALTPSGSQPSVTYGSATSPSIPIFELRQIRPTAVRPLKLSRVVFSAASPGIVRTFQALVRRLNFADGKVLLTGSPSLFRQTPTSLPSLFGDNADEPKNATEDWSSPAKAAEKDPDGNIMEVIYLPPSEYPENYSGSTGRTANSSTKQISRIMTWNYDVAASDTAPQASFGYHAPISSSLAPSRRPGRFPDEDMSPVIRRTVTTSTTLYEPAEPLASPRQNSSGLTTGALVSTLLGVAAASAAIGAGVAYGAMKNERRDEFAPPSLQRRSTYPEQPLDARSRYSEYGLADRDQLAIADRRPPPTMLTRYPHSQGPRDDGSLYDDGRSRHSSRYKTAGSAASVRTPSEVSSARKPLLLTDAEHRSYVSVGSKHSHSSSARTSEMMNDVPVMAGARSHASSRHTSASRSPSKYSAAPPPSVRRSSTYDDADSFVSTHSRRSASTIRPLQATVQTEVTTPSLAPRSKAPSRVSGATAKTSAAPSRAGTYVSAREAPHGGSRAASRAPSHVSARRLALPASGVGSRGLVYEEEEEEDDLCSIAPSDSISCVGSRPSERRGIFGRRV